MQPKEIFLEVVKSDEYLAMFAGGPTFANTCSGGRGN